MKSLLVFTFIILAVASCKKEQKKSPESTQPNSASASSVNKCNKIIPIMEKVNRESFKASMDTFVLALNDGDRDDLALMVKMHRRDTKKSTWTTEQINSQVARTVDIISKAMENLVQKKILQRNGCKIERDRRSGGISLGSTCTVGVKDSKDQLGYTAGMFAPKDSGFALVGETKVTDEASGFDYTIKYLYSLASDHYSVDISGVRKQGEKYEWDSYDVKDTEACLGNPKMDEVTKLPISQTAVTECECGCCK